MLRKLCNQDRELNEIISEIYSDTATVHKKLMYYNKLADIHTFDLKHYKHHFHVVKHINFIA